MTFGEALYANWPRMAAEILAEPGAQCESCFGRPEVHLLVTDRDEVREVLLCRRCWHSPGRRGGVEGI